MPGAERAVERIEAGAPIAVKPLSADCLIAASHWS